MSLHFSELGNVCRFHQRRKGKIIGLGCKVQFSEAAMQGSSPREFLMAVLLKLRPLTPGVHPTSKMRTVLLCLFVFFKLLTRTPQVNAHDKSTYVHKMCTFRPPDVDPLTLHAHPSHNRSCAPLSSTHAPANPLLCNPLHPTTFTACPPFS